MDTKQVTTEVLISLHDWFYHLCDSTDVDSWMDRMYVEGQIYACRELLNDFTTKIKTMSRGFDFKPDNEFFMNGYNSFKEKYHK